MSQAIAHPTTVPAAEPARSGFMISPLYDCLLFIGAPLLGLGIALAVMGGAPLAMEKATVLGTDEAWISIFIAVWTYAHLCAVLFRSHLNREIYGRFRIRFTVVPLALFIGFMVSDLLLVGAVVLAVFWDVYHTAMQNFGFCRIYDARHNADYSARARRLDILVNQLIYVAPIVGGLSFAIHLTSLNKFQGFGWTLPSEIGAFLVFIQPRLIPLLVVGGSLFLAYYVFAYWRMSQAGYRVSRQKVALLFSVGITSVWAWGFLPPFYAFFVSNFYHGLQYFGIVWAIENRNIRRASRLDRVPYGKLGAFVVFCLLLVVSGYAYKLYGNDALRLGAAFFTVITLMHFWYDSFVWQAHKLKAA